MSGYARPALKNPVGKKAWSWCIHSGPSLKAPRVAIGVLERQATLSSCTNYSEKLAGSDTGLNRHLCGRSKSRLPTCTPFCLSGSDSLLLPRGESLLSRSLSFRPTASLSLAFDLAMTYLQFASYVECQASYLTLVIPVCGHAIIGWAAGCPSPFCSEAWLN